VPPDALPPGRNGPVSVPPGELASPIGPARALSPAALLLGYFVTYCLLDWASFVRPIGGTDITAWNPQWALAVALFTRSERLFWPILVSLAAAAVQPALRHASGAELVASTFEVLGDVAIAFALRRWLGHRPTLDTRRDALIFLLVVAVGAGVQSSLYSTVLALGGDTTPQAVRTAFVSGWVGAVNLVVALPLILALCDAPRRAELAAMLRTTEWWSIAAVSMGVAYTVFILTAGEEFKHFYLLFLPAGWAAARFGNVGAMGATTLAQLLLIVAVQSLPYAPRTVFELHMLLVALGVMALLIGATVEEQRQGERELRDSLHAAASASMAAALAHELNQPLASLVNYARATQILVERDAAARPGADAIVDVTRKLTAEALRASNVVARLREFFRARTAQLQESDLGRLAEDVVHAHRARAAGAGVQLEWTHDPALPPVLVDRLQIEVVLRNLLANAIDAAVLAESPARTVCVRVEARDARLVASVTDSGPGVDERDLARVFDERPSSKPGGMGIGLSISRTIIEAHEGRLWAEPGPGGKFFFSLPPATREPQDAVA